MENECYQILGSFCLIFGNDSFRQPLDVMLEGIIHLHVGLVLAQRAGFGVEISISQDRLFEITTWGMTLTRVPLKIWGNVPDVFDILASSLFSQCKQTCLSCLRGCSKRHDKGCERGCPGAM